jgi:hypothetical protein
LLRRTATPKLEILGIALSTGTVKMVVATAIVAREPAPDSTVNWALEKVEVNPPGEDEVLVQISASGICHTDVVLTSVPNGTFGVAYPKVAGHEGMTYNYDKEIPSEDSC